MVVRTYRRPYGIDATYMRRNRKHMVWHLPVILYLIAPLSPNICPLTQHVQHQNHPQGPVLRLAVSMSLPLRRASDSLSQASNRTTGHNWCRNAPAQRSCGAPCASSNKQHRNADMES